MKPVRRAGSCGRAASTTGLVTRELRQEGSSLFAWMSQQRHDVDRLRWQ
jgi:hypothetical protein